MPSIRAFLVYSLYIILEQLQDLTIRPLALRASSHRIHRPREKNIPEAVNQVLQFYRPALERTQDYLSSHQ